MENSGLKRILEEYDKIDSNPSADFKFCKLDWNSYEWQGALRGPSGTEFEGGIYHVRLLFAEEYPWKAPSFIFLTENGSFNIKKKIRLNCWNPSWRVQDALLKLISLMPKCQDFKSHLVEHREKRRDLAKKSRAAAPKYGSYELQTLIDANHEYMQRDVPQLQLTRNTSPTQRCEEEVVVEDKCNIKNSGKKRILEEYNEIKSNPSYDFTCRKLGWNKYEWQFAIRGPSGTEFEGGIYHGVVQFSKGYPSKSPSIMFLTENGRFKIETKISLSLLSNWQSSWSLRKSLVAVIERMRTYPNGESISEENSKEERRGLAIKSRAAAPKYGSDDRQKVIDVIHPYMLSKAPPVPVPQLSPVTSQASNGTGGGPVFNINIICRDAFNIIFGNTLKSICGNTFGVSNANNVGVSNSMNEAPNPMITTKHWVFMFLIITFWSLVIPRMMN